MRRSEREARLLQLAGRLLGDARRVLVLDLALALPDREVVAERAETLSARGEADEEFDGALVNIDASRAPRARVAEVTGRLRAGAALLLVAPLGPSVGERARGLLTRTPPPRVSRTEVSEALLMAGLCTPRVHDDVPGLLLMSARVPAARTELDAFFA